MKLTGGQIVCESLLKEGVDIIFGILGGAILPLYDVLPQYPKLHHVLVRHEQGQLMLLTVMPGYLEKLVFVLLLPAPVLLIWSPASPMLNWTLSPSSLSPDRLPGLILAKMLSRKLILPVLPCRLLNITIW